MIELTPNSLTGIHSPNIPGDRAVHTKDMPPAFIEWGDMIIGQTIKTKQE